MAIGTLTPDEVSAQVRSALAEDVGSGDVTTLATVPAKRAAESSMTAREEMVFAGGAWVTEVFRQCSAEVEVCLRVTDGERVKSGTEVAFIRGPARAILTGERVALNFAQRLSGVATLTRRFVEAVSGTRARILDTRKTTPGMRRLERYAVVCGGGTNHRAGLYDAVLIKDNHLVALAGAKPNPVAEAIRLSRAAWPGLKVELEADTLEQVMQAVEMGADIIMLDNMPLQDMKRAVELVAGRAKIEASGGVRLDTVRAIAETGVDFISVGALTHSARATDLGLDFRVSYET